MRKAVPQRGLSAFSGLCAILCIRRLGMAAFVQFLSTLLLINLLELLPSA
jgi:hypothetical protein